MQRLQLIKNILVTGILLVLCESVLAGRNPANYSPRDDFSVAPIKHESWIKFISTEDKEGILNKMRNTFRTWEDQENYARVWNLQGLIVSRRDKVKYLGKNFFKYLDRRFSEEANKAKAGSSFKKIASAKKSLNPKIRINFSEHVRLRFKGRPLKGYGMMYLQNPWVDFKVQANISGKGFIECSKYLDNIDLNSKINYDVFNEKFLAQVNKYIIPEMEAKITYENFIKHNRDDLQIKIKYFHTF